MSKIEGFAFEGQGRIDRIDTFTTSRGKEIITLIFKTDGQYPQVIPIKAFGRLADIAREFKPGDLVHISGRLGGREWSGKVYGDNTADTIEAVGASEEAPEGAPGGAVPREEAPKGNSGSIPF